LSDKVRDWSAELLFDPDGIEKEGLAAIEEQKKALLKMQNDRAGMALSIKAIDDASYEKSKAAKDKIKDEEKAAAAEKKKAQQELDKFISDAEQARLDEQEALQETIRQSKLTDRELELEAVNDHYFDLIERAKLHGLNVESLEAEAAEKRKALKDKNDEEDKASSEKKKQDKKDELAEAVEVWNAKLDMASNMFGALSDLATAFAGDSEAQQKRAFNINKVVGISQAVISTAQGIMAQLAVPQSALTGTSFIKAGIVAATGAAQIATIAKTQFKGGGASSPSVPSGSVGGGDSRPAQFNVVGNNGNNQLAESLGGQVTKAYVVAGDVTTQQSLDRNKVGTATL
jgi:vacuolar-type H+-ATPase subunit I/STV1